MAPVAERAATIVPNKQDMGVSGDILGQYSFPENPPLSTQQELQAPVFDATRVQRAELLEGMFRVSNSGLQDFGQLGIPLDVNVISSHLFYVQEAENGDVAMFVRQFFVSHDSRFGDFHVGQKGEHQTSAVMVLSLRDYGEDPLSSFEGGWHVDRQFLKGDNLDLAVSHYNWLYDESQPWHENREPEKQKSTEALEEIKNEVAEVLRRGESPEQKNAA